MKRRTVELLEDTRQDSSMKGWKRGRTTREPEGRKEQLQKNAVQKILHWSSAPSVLGSSPYTSKSSADSGFVNEPLITISGRFRSSNVENRKAIFQGLLWQLCLQAVDDKLHDRGHGGEHCIILFPSTPRVP